MYWEAIGAMGEVLGAAAVFVSLLYLALQVRANTASTTIASRKSVANEFRSWNQTFLNTDPRHFSLGLSHYPAMPFQERSDFCVQLHDLVLFYQSAQAMHEAGVLPDEVHERYRTWVAGVLNTPGGQNFWLQWKAFYNLGMTAAIEERLREGNLPSLLEFPQFQLDDDPSVVR